jgi:hypothetical protein
MTSAQLTHLAELAALAADYYADNDPDSARLFGDSALRAQRLSAETNRCEATARIGAGIPASSTIRTTWRVL